MQSGRTVDNKLLYYVCGRCGMNIYYRKQDKPTVPCPECGWNRLAVKENDVPSSFKFNINQF